MQLSLHRQLAANVWRMISRSGSKKDRWGILPFSLVSFIQTLQTVDRINRQLCYPWRRYINPLVTDPIYLVYLKKKIDLNKRDYLKNLL